MKTHMWPKDLVAAKPYSHSRWSEFRFNLLSIALASIAIGLFFGFLLVCLLLGSWIGGVVWGMFS
jgi:hypothetical protein